MVKSMTGYGRGEAQAEGIAVTVELRSVNNRYLDASFKLPRTYLFAESALKERLQARVGRGKVDVFVNLEHTAASQVTVSVNQPMALAYLDALDQLRELGKKRGLKSKVDPLELAKLPDVLTVEKREEDREAVKDAILTALEAALDDFDAMRVREGAKLQADIEGRADTIAALLTRVEERSPSIVEDYRTRLLAKLQEVLGNTQLDESRVLTEAAIYADKVAVDEETVRLRSHLGQLHEMFSGGGALGRKLDFLIQEFNREANTIGSKCADMETAKIVVDIKAEIEKIREQVQNLE